MIAGYLGMKNGTYATDGTYETFVFITSYASYKSDQSHSYFYDTIFGYLQ